MQSERLKVMLCYDIVKREIDQLQAFVCKVILILYKYSKTCLKQPLKNRQNKDINDKW